MQAIQQPRVSCWSCHRQGARVARFWHSRSQSIQCQAHSTQTCTAAQGGAATRRAMLLGLPICTAAAAAIPQQAQAGVTQCNYQKAASGLQWCDTKQGEGKSPVKGASIRCHYTGRLDSGSVFDSSYERRKPLSFKIGVRQVIAGWDVGILGSDDIPPMKEGGKRSLIIPASLGYGPKGAGGVIPPNATLYFDVELLPSGKK